MGRVCMRLQRKQHPFVGIGVALTLAAAFMALLWRCCLSDDDEGFEMDPLPMEADQGEGDVDQTKPADEGDVGAVGGDDESASEGGEEGAGVDESVPAAQTRPKSTRQRARRTET